MQPKNMKKSDKSIGNGTVVKIKQFLVVINLGFITTLIQPIDFSQCSDRYIQVKSNEIVDSGILTRDRVRYIQVAAIYRAVIIYTGSNALFAAVDIMDR